MVAYPEDWKECNIDDCAYIFQGGTPSTTNPKYWNGDVVWLTPGEITNNKGMYINNSERKITMEGVKNSSAVLLPKGTILLCTRATIGALAIADRELATNQGFKNLFCKQSTNNVFLAYLLLTKKDEMISKAIGTTFLEISKKELSKITVCIPELPEQQAIALVLADFDEHISNLTKLIEKKKAIRDGALEDLVSGKTRIDAFDGDWEIVDFDDVIIPKARIGWQGLKKDEYLTRGYSYLIGGTDFQNGTISLEGISYVSKERYDMDFNIQVNQEDVLVTKDGTIGKVALVPKLDKPATLNSGVYVFKTNKRVESVYLYRILTSSIFKNFISQLSAGSTIKHLYQKDLKNFKFEIPIDTKEQQAIASILTAIDEEIESLEIEKAKMIQIREGAMDDLLTGRVRLKK